MIQSDPHQAQTRKGKMANAIKQPQNEQMESRGGNLFSKKVAMLLPKPKWIYIQLT